MPKTVLALGLDPAVADLTQFPGLTPELIRAYIDAVHEQAPAAKICFNSSPRDTAEAVQRWV